MSSVRSLESQLREVGAIVRVDLLELTGNDQRPARQLRVSEGRVFGRNQTDGRWSEADWRELPVDELMEYFLADSPVATWLRERGADLIQSALLSMVWPR